MSPATVVTLTPVAAAISAPVCSSASRVRATMVTSTPSCASAKAQALPRPLLAPLSSAFLPRIPRSNVGRPSVLETSICRAVVPESAYPVTRRRVMETASDCPSPGSARRLDCRPSRPMTSVGCCWHALTPRRPRSGRPCSRTACRDRAPARCGCPWRAPRRRGWSRACADRRPAGRAPSSAISPPPG